MLIGNVTRDPRVQRTKNGSVVAHFGLAMNRTIPGEDGERREEATFVEVEAWNRLAETVEQYVTKGRKLYIEGRLKFETWEDRKSGDKRTKVSVVAERLEFADPPPGTKRSGDSGRGESSDYRDETNSSRRRESAGARR